MDISNANIKEAVSRLERCRLRILTNNAFFGNILLNMEFAIDNSIDTFSCFDNKIYYNMDYLISLSEYELDITILHSLLHIILKHPFRNIDNRYDKDLYHEACDIIVNSNIINAKEGAPEELVVKGKALPHLTPTGNEGYNYSVDEVYNMLLKAKGLKKKRKLDDDIPSQNIQQSTDKRLTTPVLTITCDTDGIIYLACQTGSDYATRWDLSPAYTNKKQANPWLLTSYKLEVANAELVHTKIKLLDTFNFSNVPIPGYFTEKTDPYLIDDAQTIEPKNKTYEFESYNYPIYEEDVSTLRNIKYPNIVLTIFEQSYSNYVYNTYMNVPSTFIKPIDDIINKLNLKLGDISAIHQLRKYLSANFKYDLNYKGNSKAKDVVLNFLTVSKTGVCYHFASVMVFLLRRLNIPARYVSGVMYQVKKANQEEVVEKLHLHAWVEVYLNKIGWVTVEATPSSGGLDGESGDTGNSKDGKNGNSFDIHDKWDKAKKMSPKEISEKEENIDHLTMESKKMLDYSRKGTLPCSILKQLESLTNPQVDWKEVLIDFIQEDVVDYSFNPPDRRFQESPFILPDYNEKEDAINNILFMIDSSGSMQDQTIFECFNEIKGAIAQFNGQLKGKVAFFSTYVNKVYDIDDDTNILKLRPSDRGGTDFNCIFKYIFSNMKADELPTTLVILTDGACDYPKETIAKGIPVLWIIDNPFEDITPPWGRVVKVHYNKNKDLDF